MTAPLWTFDAFVAAIRGRPTGAGHPAVTGVSIDSRTVQPGEAFFAIKGDRFEGHDFVGAAMAHGAGLAVVLSSGLRDKVLDLLFGPEETFDYVPAANGNGATPSAAPSGTPANN